MRMSASGALWSWTRWKATSLREDPKSKARSRDAIAFACVSICWLALDLLAKRIVDVADPDTILWEGIPGFLDFTLVHNTGGAWGLFSGIPWALGVFSLIVCALCALYVFVIAPGQSMVGVIGLALVFAGGIGNAIDRFQMGYVVDFIQALFIDFPVFNIADIGVTCGFALFLVSLFLKPRSLSESADSRSTDKPSPSSDDCASNGGEDD